MRCSILTRTSERFGRSINPHLFRDCAATSFATAEKYYNQAPMLSAVRTYSNEMLRLRSDLLEVFDNQAVRDFLVRAQSLTGDEDGI